MTSLKVGEAQSKSLCIGIFLVFQPQSNKKKKERGKGKRRKKEEKERGDRRRKEGKENDKIFISLFLKEIPIPAYPNQQVFPPGYPNMAN